MKNLKKTSLLFLIGIFTATIVVGQSTQRIDYDTKIATLEKEMDNSGLTIEEFDKKVAEIAQLIREKENPFYQVLETHKMLSAKNPDGTSAPAFMFDQGIEELTKLLSSNNISDPVLKMSLELVNKEYNFYDKLINNGYAATSALAIKVKSLDSDQSTRSQDYEMFKADFIAWTKLSNADSEEDEEINLEE